MKKVAVWTFLANNTEWADSRAIGNTLIKAGYSVDYYSLKEAASNPPSPESYATYDVTFIPVQVAALHNATSSKYRVLEGIFKRSRKLVCYACDTTMPLDPGSWVGGQVKETKYNLYAVQPVHFLACFTDSILKDEKAMSKIQRHWLNKSHPDSTLTLCEWTTFHRDSFPAFLERMKQSAGLFPVVPEGDHIASFYYGAFKKGVAKSLEESGFGKDENDAVFGSIHKAFPYLRNYRPTKRGIVNADYLWLNIVPQVESIPIPYEPIKGDYQVTLRMLESLLLYPDKALVDERIASDLIPFTQSLDEWEKRAGIALERLLPIIED